MVYAIKKERRNEGKKLVWPRFLPAGIPLPSPLPSSMGFLLFLSCFFTCLPCQSRLLGRFWGGTRARRDSPSSYSNCPQRWLSWFFSPNWYYPQVFNLFCSVRVLYPQIPPKPSFWNICPRFFKAVPRYRMTTLEGRKLFTCLFPDPWAYDKYPF